MRARKGADIFIPAALDFFCLFLMSYILLVLCGGTVPPGHHVCLICWTGPGIEHRTFRLEVRSLLTATPNVQFAIALPFVAGPKGDSKKLNEHG